MAWYYLGHCVANRKDALKRGFSAAGYLCLRKRRNRPASLLGMKTRYGYNA